MEKEKSSETHDPKTKLEQAILEKDLLGIIGSIEVLNTFLVGEGSAFSLPESDKKEIESLFSEESGSVKIYLGDGGVSRLFIEKDGEKVNVSLGEASSEIVKERWKEI